MPIVTANELDDILNALISKNKKPEKILIGYKAYSRSLAKVNSRASNSPFQQLNSFLDQIVSVYFYTVLLISENI